MKSVSISIEWLFVDGHTHEATEEENCQVFPKAQSVEVFKMRTPLDFLLV